jgi:hypothetical protein
MIRIRSSDGIIEPTLIGIEATLRTDQGIYSLSCSEPLLDGSNPLAGGLFGSIAWPRACFHIAPGVQLEQQAFLANEGAAAAFSWQLTVAPLTPVYLQVRPFFAGCRPRSYRDPGFRFQSPEDGGRLTWLPSVLGPMIIADTNGSCRAGGYFENDGVYSEDLIDAGLFEFQLSSCPSVLILTNDRIRDTHNGALLGTFLAGLMPGSPQSHAVSEAASGLITPALAA